MEYTLLDNLSKIGHIPFNYFFLIHIIIYTYLKINSSHYKIKSLRGCFHVNKSRKHKKNKIVMEVYEITSILHFF